MRWLFALVLIMAQLGCPILGSHGHSHVHRSVHNGTHIKNTPTLRVKRIFDYGNTKIQMPPMADAVTGFAIRKRGFLHPNHSPVTYDVYYVKNAFFMDQSELLVRDQHGKWIRELSAVYIELNELRSASYIASHKPEDIHGNVLYVRAACQYWHIHHETIAQLLLYRMAGVFQDFGPSNLTVVMEQPCTAMGLNKEMMEFYGFDLFAEGYRIKLIQAGQLFRVVGGVLIASTPTHRNLPTLFIPAFVNSYVRAHTAPRASAPKRIYVDREEGYRRRVKNRPALLALLAQYDISLYSPLQHPSYQAQREVFAGAQLVMSAEGTGFSTNGAFCDPNRTIMIELFGNPIHTRTGAMVMTMLGFQHYYMLSPSYGQDNVTGDFNVNVSSIALLLHRLLGPPKTKVIEPPSDGFIALLRMLGLGGLVAALCIGLRVWLYMVKD